MGAGAGLAAGRRTPLLALGACPLIEFGFKTPFCGVL